MIEEWLANYLIHSTLLLGLATLSPLVPALRKPALQDLLWRLALIGGLLTASAQTFSPHGSLVEVEGLFASPVDQSGETVIGPAQSPANRLAGAPPITAPPAPDLQDTDHLTQPHAGNSEMAPVLQDWRPALILAWLLGGGALLTGLLRDLVAERRLLAGCRRLKGDELDALCGNLAIPEGVSICVAPHISVPLSTRRGEIVLPETFSALPEASRRAAVAHELGHIRRRDPLWRLLGRLVRAGLFFQPLNWIAARRLDHWAEVLSDQAALDDGPRSRLALARSLLFFAEQRGCAVPATACAMAHAPGPLAERVRKVLEEPRVKVLSRRNALTGALVMLLAAAVVLPGVSARSTATTVAGSGDNIRSIQVREDDG
ncbi:MAG: M56 family metallopeptidase, partial [Xanthomonadales bacterium]|nr:M56 family metallopeptidase [Xanthomonadales bacterium]